MNWTEKGFYMGSVDLARVRHYTYKYRRSGNVYRKKLVACYEVDYTAISDHYMYDDIGAEDLFAKWTVAVREKYPDGLVPIDWYVAGYDNHFERMPRQYNHHPQMGDFLDSYTWPVDDDGRSLDWKRLPVARKGWTRDKAHKGGFLEKATGWRPSILQSHVYIESLLTT